ncbi:type IV secretion system protein [Fusobacterium nucleatum]|uniref:type IV secretion system protein n=1 Tax=Fusobacterium nucleatum TaxID=851 RepID=UPI0030B55A5E
METNILTQILKRFTIYLEDLPSNLRLISHTLLFFLATIDIALTVYTNIDNENFSYYKWIKNKILKLGFILFAINQYEWLLSGIKSFFFDVVEKAIRVRIYDSEYFENPSLLYKKGTELAFKIYDEGVHWYDFDTWIFAIFYFLITLGFLIMTLRLIICWIEYYFLTGISIIFLPFGVLDIGLTYYKNVFNVIISSSIKLAVMNFWLLLGTNIMNDLFKITVDDIDFDKVSLIVGVIYIIVGVVQVLPSLTTGLLTGSPSVNASAAMAGATGAIKGMGKGIADAYRGGKEVAKGAWEGGKTGANVGGTALGAVGSLVGPIGTATGKIVGGTIGAVGGAAVGGSYAGARYAIFKEKGKDKIDNDNEGNSDYRNSSSRSSNNGTSSQGGSSGGTSGGTPNQQNSNSSSNNGDNLGSSPQSPPNNTSSEGTGSVNSNAQAQMNISQSAENDVSTNTNSVSNDTGTTNNSTSSNTGNNVDNSNNDTNSTANVDTTSNISSDTGNGAEKRGLKVNGGEAGKLPEWMKDDY